MRCLGRLHPGRRLRDRILLDRILLGRILVDRILLGRILVGRVLQDRGPTAGSWSSARPTGADSSTTAAVGRPPRSGLPRSLTVWSEACCVPECWVYEHPHRRRRHSPEHTPSAPQLRRRPTGGA